MIDHSSVVTTPQPIGVSLRASPLRSTTAWRWEFAAAGVALVASVAAVWVTLDAHFLAYPDWLAVQKADFILGPVGVGLYWRHRRPNNRLGLLLIVLGLAGIPYILESTAAPALFGVGLASEGAIYLMTSAVILAFPSGRIEGAASWLIIAVVVLFTILTTTVFALAARDVGPGFSISGCRSVCPANGLAIWSTPAWLTQLNDVQGVVLVGVPIATAGVLVWRFVTGTPPRRRALSIGAPIALLFLTMQASYRLLFFLAPDGLALSAHPVHSAIQWTFAAARSSIWYGFLFALISAELFAGRALRRLVDGSLGRPSFRELEGLLRRPLGDPTLRLGFWRRQERDWVDADGSVLKPPASGQVLTAVDRDGEPAVAIVHDEQLRDDPELLLAAGAVALLALENAELDAGWREALGELRASRARIVEAAERERRRLERDLHDGAQQRLMAIQVKLRLAVRATQDGLAEQLEEIGQDAAQAVEALRTLAHGIYPSVLSNRGLAEALRAVAMSAPISISVTDGGIGRCSAAIEAAIYYCTLEAIQNAIKHAGGTARVDVVLGRKPREVRFAVTDDGVGMPAPARSGGVGLTSMRDRVGAVGGELEIITSPGRGTTVRGRIPSDESEPALRHARELL